MWIRKKHDYDDILVNLSRATAIIYTKSSAQLHVDTTVVTGVSRESFDKIMLAFGNRERILVIE